jgi:hypothetical protein
MQNVVGFFGFAVGAPSDMEGLFTIGGASTSTIQPDYSGEAPYSLRRINFSLANAARTAYETRVTSISSYLCIKY